ncbi:MAG: hypothetical protein ACOYLB_15765 [Phototrophicaceae bacterium]
MSLVEYTYFHDAIHYFKFLSSRSTAVDEFLLLYQPTLLAHNPQRPFLLVIDVTASGLPPITYVVPTVRKFYRQTPPPPILRSVFIFRDRMLVRIGEGAINLLNVNATRRFIHESERDDAIRWLLDNTPK